MTGAETGSTTSLPREATAQSSPSPGTLWASQSSQVVNGATVILTTDITSCGTWSGGSVVYCIPGSTGPVTVTVLPPNVVLSTASSLAMESSFSTSSANSGTTVSITSIDTLSLEQSTVVLKSTMSPSASARITTNSNEHGPGTGVLAGATVGCLFAGFLIAGLLGYLFMKKRSRHVSHVTDHVHEILGANEAGAEKCVPAASVVAITGLEFLPQQADEAEVGRKLSEITTKIDEHVDTFYRNLSIPLDINLEEDLARFETSRLPQPIAACFDLASNPTTLIKHCLAFHISNLILAPGAGTQPLLPAEIAGMIASVYRRSLDPSVPRDLLAAFSAWKSLTRYLLPDLARDSAASGSIEHSSRRIAASFTTVFSAWAKPAFSGDHRSRLLAELVCHATDAGIWLFGQSDVYEFD